MRLRNRHLLAVDLFLIALATPLAFVLRLDLASLASHRAGLGLYLLLALAVKPPLLYAGGAYRRLWRYATTRDLNLLLAGVAAGGALLTLLVGLLSLTHLVSPAIPRTVPLIDLLLTGALLAGTRLLVKQWRRRVRRREPAPRRALIVGAGEAGVLVMRELHDNPRAGLVPVGLIDDDPTKQGLLLHGVPVLGGRAALAAVAQARQVEELIIAMPTAPGQVIREIVATSERLGLPCRTLPSLTELVEGRVVTSQLRSVEIEDLLRRSPVSTDLESIGAHLAGATVLVTGAGGSIGAELCHQVARCSPRQVVLLGHGENSIFAVERELRARFPTVNWQPVIADVRDAAALQAILRQARPRLVFHAAAHKHVPLMEAGPSEAVLNNVLGTATVVEAALAAGVERLVLISSDKAVNPANVMGATKRVAELVVQAAAARSRRPYVAVRFGNVLGSRGSVVPLFKEQIAAGGPMTVTHPEVTRYFMTIREAVQLVLQASVLGNGAGGEVFVLDMGAPVRIVDLARDLIALSGLEPGRDIEIVFTGLRPGEKLYEELFIDSEHFTRTRHPKIMIAHGQAYSGLGRFEAELGALIAAAQRRDDRAVLAGLRRMLPEYRPAAERPPAARLAPAPPPTPPGARRLGPLTGARAVDG